MVSVWLRLLPQLLTSDKLAPEYMIRHGPTICHDHFANIPQRNVQINAQFEKRILKKWKPKKNSGSPSIRWLLFFNAKSPDDGDDGDDDADDDDDHDAAMTTTFI